MAIAQTLQRYLDGRVTYDIVSHEPTATSARTAEASHISGTSLAKGVLLKGNGSYLLAVIPASRRVQLDEVAKLVNQPVSMATEDEIGALFADCDRGAVPSIGSAYGVQTVIDESLGDAPEIYVEGGDHRSLIHLTQQQFGTLMGDARHGRIASQI
jgi:Ala-tRNA(Pro) deacylase